jgi:hypothetical protein
MVAIKGKKMKCEVNSPSTLLDNEDSRFLRERAKQAGGFLNNSPLLSVSQKKAK